MQAKVVAYIGLGSNLGDRVGNCREALTRISALPMTRLVATSSFYLTSPVGYLKQGDFVNATCEIKTGLHPRELLFALKGIEKAMGRAPAKRWGPRLIDLDILLYDHAWINEEDLEIPHPRLHERRFVLIPLCEIAPYVLHPLYGITMKGLLERLEDGKEKVEMMVGGLS
ncbi:MAG TPA: 2-amino-4-hydroxy-6-hydroxymethyldihydropteridine diphosphokinase [Syntrophales bacterium]|nr:2-amino-4-hydroxy-6-hydroxymethyldihydropteridine diphosphokinase [Syntrophales bacterium]HOL58568.1 2-amino-4-hydroxy-6-hydroxymethyldihydropteridine diphosphokinase [Syntrophales bacterium]HPO34824.1 2-amino-4-hydroxy-6-hydroxymethyldihydropteridine diphosphokinase [Syntrophales bacterium]